MIILTLNLVFSTFVFALAARFYLLPKLREMKIASAVQPMLLLHAFRHLGLMFLASGATYPGIPLQFAYPAAFGDLLAAVLALLALGAVVGNASSSRPLLWIFNVEGTVDLIAATSLATLYGAPDFMGAAYWIPAFWVPALLVTHYLMFTLLLRKGEPSPSDLATSRIASGARGVGAMGHR